jgi:hypothetical protein
MNDKFRSLQRLAVEYDGYLRAGAEDSDEAVGCLEEIACYYFHATDEECEAFNNFTSYLERRRNSMSTVTETVYESRWGFHPVSYETFRKLKFLHKWYYQTLKDFARWKRWIRKFPHNRKGPQPQYCPTFVRRELFCVPRGIVAAYQQARIPLPRDLVKPLDLSDAEIDNLYQEVKAWVDKQGKTS